MTRTLAALFSTASVACVLPQDESSGPRGVAYVRLSAFDGPCTATQPLQGVPATCPPTNRRCAVDQMTDLPFTSARGPIAFEAASQWGGNLLAAAWENPDGSISRFQIDIGPNRAYGLSHFPYPNPVVTATGVSFDGLLPPPEGVQEAIGYVEWAGGSRQFVGTSVTSAIINYGGLFVTAETLPDSDVVYTHVAFDGVGPGGETRCRVVGMRALRTAERSFSYDPSWLEPNPTMLLGNDRVWPPSLTGDTEPARALVAGADAPADPGGTAPELPIKADQFYAQGYFYVPPNTSAGGGAG